MGQDEGGSAGEVEVATVDGFQGREKVLLHHRPTAGSALRAARTRDACTGLWHVARDRAGSLHVQAPGAERVWAVG